MILVLSVECKKEIPLKSCIIYKCQDKKVQVTKRSKDIIILINVVSSMAKDK